MLRFSEAFLRIIDRLSYGFKKLLKLIDAFEVSNVMHPFLDV